MKTSKKRKHGRSHIRWEVMPGRGMCKGEGGEIGVNWLQRFVRGWFQGRRLVSRDFPGSQTPSHEYEFK